MIDTQPMHSNSFAKRQNLDDEPRIATPNCDLALAVAKSYELASFYSASPSHTFFRTLELVEYDGTRMHELVIDLGCGDGGFASLLFSVTRGRVWLVGIDLSVSELRKAGKLRAHDSLILADLRVLPLRSASVPTFISNSVLEHVPHFELAIKEIARCLQIGGSLYSTFVTENILLGLVLLPRSHSSRLRTKVETLMLGVFNRIYSLRQKNFVEPRIYVSTLIKSAFRVVQMKDLLSKRGLLVWHWLHLATVITQLISILGDPLRAVGITRATVSWGLRCTWRKPRGGSMSNIFVHAEKVA